MVRYEDEYEPRHTPGSRISVLMVGLVVGALIMTGVWVGIAGNPLSDENEVVYETITVASIDSDRDTVCWSEEPGRRDAAQLCAILALDPEVEIPEDGDRVVLGLVMLAPPGKEATRQAVYVARVGRSRASEPDTPTPTESQ